MRTPPCLDKTACAVRAGIRGFTLIELLTVVTIVAILAAVAAPSFTGYLGRENVKGAANETFADLQFARSESVQRNLPVTFTFNATGYTISQSATTLKTVVFDGGGSISAGSTLVATFDPVRGTATTINVNPAAVVISNPRTSGTLRVNLNTMGRPSLCSPSASIVGFPTCT